MWFSLCAPSAQVPFCLAFCCREKRYDNCTSRASVSTVVGSEPCKETVQPRPMICHRAHVPCAMVTVGISWNTKNQDFQRWDDHSPLFWSVLGCAEINDV